MSLPANIEKNIPFPKKLRDELVEAILPGFSEDIEHIRIVIRTHSRDLNIRQLSYFLVLIDRFYGRLHPESIINYARYEDIQIKIDEIRLGSVEILLQTFKNFDPARIILLWAILKFLPNIIVSITTSIKNLSSAYKEFQEGLQIKETRKQLKKELGKNENLSHLEKENLNVLSHILTYLYSKESKYLLQAGRFVEKYIKSIELQRIGKKDKEV